jgi:hypothetical protein
MALFNHLRLVKFNKGKDLAIKYEDNTLIVIKVNTAKKLFTDFCSQKFINELASMSTLTKGTAQEAEIAGVLNQLYAKAKKQHYNNDFVKPIETKSKDYKNFLMAARILIEFKVTPEQYIQAQIEGYSFTGKFPSIKMLCNSYARDNVLNYLNKDVALAKKQKEEDDKKLIITKFDRETEFMKNPKYTDIYDAWKRGEEITYKQAKFMYDIQMIRNERVSRWLKDLVKELREKDKTE